MRMLTMLMGLLGWMVLPAWTKPLFECLPSEAMMVLHVKDTKLLMEQWQDTPFQRIFEDLGIPTEGMPDLAHWRTLIGDAVMSVHLEQKRFVGRALLLPVE